MKGFFTFAFLMAAVSTLVSSEGLAQRTQASPEERALRLKDSLALNDVQVKTVTKIYEASDARRKELFESSGGDRQSMREGMRVVIEQSDAKIDSLLTPEQREKFAQMRKRQMERRQEFRRRND